MVLYFTAVVFERGKGIIVLKPKTRGQYRAMESKESGKEITGKEQNKGRRKA